MRVSLQSYVSAFLAVAALLFFSACDTSTDPALDEDTPSVEFASSGTGAVPLDTTATVPVRINNPDGNEVSVEVLFAEGASGVTAAELGGYTTQTVTFPAQADHGDVQEIAVDISAVDITGGQQSAFFALQNLRTSGEATISGQREFALNIGPAPIATVREQPMGSTVTFEGVVTRAHGAYVRMQDDSGELGASGIVIRQTQGDLADDFQADISSGNIQPGTRLLITGELSQFSQLMQINDFDLASYDILPETDVPEPMPVSLADISTDYESVLVRIEDIFFANPSGSFENQTSYTVEDDEGNSLTFRVQRVEETDVAGDPMPGDAFTYEGVVGRFNEEIQLIPVNSADIISDDEPGDPGDPGDPDVVTIAEARAMDDGSEVTFDAILTRGFGQYLFFQDETGALQAFNFDGWSELDDDTIAQGDELRVTGTLETFSGLRQVSVSEMEVLSSDNDLPDAQVVTIDEINTNGEDYESELVRVEGLTVDTEDQTWQAQTSYDATDDTGTGVLRIQREEGTELVGEDVPEGEFTFEGPLSRFDDTFQLQPVLTSDIIEDGGNEPQVITIAEARAEADGEIVTVEAVVTRTMGEYLIFQDETGALQSFRFNGTWEEEQGDLVRITGEMDTFNELRQVSVDNIEVLSTGNDLPDPVELTLQEINQNGEDYESQLVRVTGLTIDAQGDFEVDTSYDVNDGTDDGVLRINRTGSSEWIGESIPQGTVTFEGPLGRFNSTFQLLPMLLSDLTEE